MNIKILSDSTCDLPQQLLDENNITLVPLTVIKNDAAYRDGVDITPAVIFDHVAAGGALCSTSAVSVGEYEDIFAQYSPDYDAVILINLGSGFSSTHQNARVASQEFDNVYCVDSKNCCFGEGMMAILAATLRDEGKSGREIAEKLENLKSRLRIFAYMNCIT